MSFYQPNPLSFETNHFFRGGGGQKIKLFSSNWTSWLLKWQRVKMECPKIKKKNYSSSISEMEEFMDVEFVTKH